MRAAILLLLVSIAPGFAQNCDCSYAPACEAINDIPALFLGHVLNAGPSGDGPFHFAIDEPIKGLAAGTREVDVYPMPCGAAYKRGERYLVLAGRGRDGVLISSDCKGIVAAWSTEADIEFLRGWARGKRVPQLQGRVAADIDESSIVYSIQVEHKPGLSGVRITATKDGKTFQGVSDSTGFFRVPVPEPGVYAVTASYPDRVSSEPEYEFEVESGSCVEHDIGMWTDTRVTGRLLDPAGKPAPGVPVELALLPPDSRFLFTAITDASGAFEFGKLDNGDYLLGVNINGTKSAAPYEPCFYPGVARREDAVVVHVEGPGVSRVQDFRVSRRLSTRLILVKVVWPDGRPVTNASVVCNRLGAYERISRYTDPKGEATFEVLSDRGFEIQVESLNWAHSSTGVKPSRPKFQVQAGTGLADVRIVIDRVNDISDRQAPLDMSGHNNEKTP